MNKLERVISRIDDVLIDLGINYDQCSTDDFKVEIGKDIEALEEAQKILSKLNNLNPICLKNYL